MSEPGLDPTGDCGVEAPCALDASEQYLENMIQTLRDESDQRFATVATAMKDLMNLVAALGKRIEQVDRNAHV